MSFKPFIRATGEKNFYGNGQAFATHDEADRSGHNRFMQWFGADEYKVVESDEPVNYRWDNELGDVRLPDPEEVKS